MKNGPRNEATCKRKQSQCPHFHAAILEHLLTLAKVKNGGRSLQLPRNVNRKTPNDFAK